MTLIVQTAGDERQRESAGQITGSKRDRFESARGKAQVKWRTDELMALLRGTE